MAKNIVLCSDGTGNSGGKEHYLQINHRKTARDRGQSHHAIRRTIHR